MLFRLLVEVAGGAFDFSDVMKAEERVAMAQKKSCDVLDDDHDDGRERIESNSLSKGIQRV